MTSPHRAAGRLLVAGFDGLELPSSVAEALSVGRIGGAILFSRNIESASQTARLVHSILRSGTDTRPIVSVDQEGGRVQRLGWSHWPSAAALGATGDQTLSRQVGAAMGEELAACGFDLDFAPVLDLNTNPDNPVIGDRAFGQDQEASTWALAWSEGIMEKGVAACGKHFPGHGDTSLDSHKALPLVTHSLERIQAVELDSFRKAAPHLPFMMTAHVLFPALDANRPATLSRPILEGILRRRLGFNGIIVSDDLEMAGARAFGDVPDLAVESIASGADMVLVCTHSELAFEASAALEKEARRSPAFRNLVDESLARLAAFRQRFPGPVPDPRRAEAVCGSQRHRSLARQVRDLAHAGSQRPQG